MKGDPTDLERKIQETIQRLDEASAELESLMAGEIDTVMMPESGRLMLLREAEAALAESQARYHRLVTRMAALVFELTPEGTVQFVNEAATVTGYAPIELVGRNWWEVLCPGTLHRQRERLMSRLQDDDVSNYEMTLLSRDGRERIFELNTANRYQPNGRLQTVVGLGIDVTERKHAQEALQQREREFRTMVETWPDLVARFDRDQRHLYVSPAVEKATGLPPQSFIGKTNRELGMPEENVRQWEESIRRVFTSGKICLGEFSFSGPKGTFYYENLMVPELGPNGEVQTVVSWARDITERKQAEAQQRLIAAVFDSSNEAVLITDTTGHILMVNQAFTRISSYTPEEVTGKDLGVLCSDRQNEVLDRQVWQNLTRNQWQGEFSYRRKNGEVYPVWQNVGVVKDEQGLVQNYVVVFSDISSMKRAQERMIHLAHHDALTDIPNRLLFTANLDLALESARRHNGMLGLLFLDLDRFKFINDTLGHVAGDRLLKAVAQRLTHCIRAEDTVARLGGDEFTVILSEVAHARDAAAVAADIIERIAQPVHINNHEIITSASIGISIFPHDATNRSDLIRTADMALYRAKESGRNNYQFFTRELTEQAQAHLRIEQGLHHALEEQEFAVHYQPLISLDDGILVGVEALLRWNHPELGLTEPAEFIHIAEETGLIGPIGEWVLRTACTQARDWQREGLPPIHMSINVSTRQLMQGNLFNSLQQILTDCEVLPNDLQLDLEITENVLQVVEQHQELLSRIKSMGIMLAIDDFGTGYSSLSRLRELPIDTLKIDRSFVHDIPQHTNDMAITSAIVAMAHSLNIKVVAEGIENIEQLGFLRSLHCEEGQGYFFSRPVPAEAIHEMLVSGIRFTPSV